MIRNLLIKLMVLAFVFGVTISPAIADSDKHGDSHKSEKHDKKDKHDKHDKKDHDDDEEDDDHKKDKEDDGDKKEHAHH